MLDLEATLTQAFANLISGLVTNLVWILLLAWGIGKISKSINNLASKIPHYIEDYDKIKMKHLATQRALR